MLDVGKNILKKQTEKAIAFIKGEIDFFKKPASLVALSAGAIAILNNYANNLLGDISGKIDGLDIDNLHQIKNFLKTDPTTKAILDYANYSINDDIVADLLLKCENINEEVVQEFNNLEFYSESTKEIISTINDINSKISKFRNSNEIFLNENSKYISIVILGYYIVKLVIDLFENTEFPSIYRLKYIQKLLRAALANIWIDIKGEFDKIKGFFIKIDELLITVGTAAALYLYNKKISREKSEKRLQDNMCEGYVVDFPLKPDSNLGPLNISEASLVCDKTDPQPLVPKKPFNEEDGLSCEVTEEIEDIFDDSGKDEIATKAIIYNRRKEKLIPKIKVNSNVNEKTVIATLGGLDVYSPVIGKVSYIHDGSIGLRDISEPTEDYTATTINNLNEKYKEYNDIKMFLTSWEVISLYPLMLKDSFGIDTSINKESKIEILGVNVYNKFENIKKFWEKLNEDYEKNVKIITSEDNIKTHSENENLYKIKDDIDKENEKIIKYLSSIQKESIDIGRKTVAEKNEFALIEYYLFELGINLNTLSDPDDIVKKYRTQINEYIDQRYVIDGYKPKKIKDRGNFFLDKLEKGATIGDWFQKGIGKYNERKKIKDVENWLKGIAKDNKDLEENEREDIVSKLLFLYEFYFRIESINKKWKDLKETDTIKQLKKEASWIKGFFDNLLLRFSSLPKEIKDLENLLQSLTLFNTYNLQDVDSEQHRIYTINKDEEECEIKSTDKRSLDLNDIRYWLKWCSFATLASVVNPATGWSTGFIGPSGSILFPTVYIPIKPLNTKYGFILFGLTITGIYLFPLVLFTNYTSEYAFPILDPTAFLKEQVKNLKDSISKELSVFKKETLNSYLEKLINEADYLTEELNFIKNKIKDHRENRPPGGSKYLKENIEWKEVKYELKEEEYKIKTKKWGVEKKYALVESVVNGGKLESGNDPADKALSSLEKTEESINKGFDKLDELLSKANKIAAPLPITLKPFTTNFSATIKNIPSPSIFKKIEDDLDQTINEKPVDKLFNKFKLNNEGFMKGPVEFAETTYKSAREAAKVTMINKEPFPAYEDLSITNVAWMKFLNGSFVPTGAKTYGFPGQPPYPIG